MELQVKINILENYFKKGAWNKNLDKTKLTIFSKHEALIKNKTFLLLGSNFSENVASHTYLGILSSCRE